MASGYPNSTPALWPQEAYLDSQPQFPLGLIRLLIFVWEKSKKQHLKTTYHGFIKTIYGYIKAMFLLYAISTVGTQ